MSNVLQRLEKVEAEIKRLRNRATFGGGGMPPSAHGATHLDGGSDALDVTDLDGFPGGTTDFLRADGSFATPPGAPAIDELTGDVTAGPGSGAEVATLAAQFRTRAIEAVFDGGGEDLEVGTLFVCRATVPVTALAWRLFTRGESGDLELGVYAGSTFLPTSGDSITGGNNPELAGADEDSGDMTGWSPAIAFNDWVVIEVLACSGITWASLQLPYDVDS